MPSCGSVGPAGNLRPNQTRTAGWNEYEDRYPHQDLVFPDAGHSVGGAFPYAVGTVSFPTPTGPLILGGTQFGNSVAATSAWQHVLAFPRRLS